MKIGAAVLLLMLAACEVGESFDKTLNQQVRVPVPALSCSADPCAVDIPFSATAADMAAWHDQLAQHDDVTVDIQAVEVRLDEAVVLNGDGAVVAPVTVERWSASLSTPAGTLAQLAGGSGPLTPPVVLDEDGVGRTDVAFHTGASIHAQGVVRMSVPAAAAKVIARTPGAILQVKLSWKVHIDVRQSLL